jgi:acetolactate synthase-1/2/3 large subunit
VLYYDENFIGTTKESGYLTPNIEYIAKAFGLNYFQVKNAKYMVLPDKTQSITEICLPDITTVIPKLEFDHPLNEMMPYPENDDD